MHLVSLAGRRSDECLDGSAAERGYDDNEVSGVTVDMARIHLRGCGRDDSRGRWV